jgi:hypothetical protein
MAHGPLIPFGLGQGRLLYALGCVERVVLEVQQPYAGARQQVVDASVEHER